MVAKLKLIIDRSTTLRIQRWLISLHNNFQKDRRAKRWLQSWNLKKLTVAPPSGFKNMKQMRFKKWSEYLDISIYQLIERSETKKVVTKNWQKPHSQVSKIWDKWDKKNDQNYLRSLHNNFQKVKELTVAPPSALQPPFWSSIFLKIIM